MYALADAGASRLRRGFVKWKVAKTKASRLSLAVAKTERIKTRNRKKMKMLQARNKKTAGRAMSVPPVLPGLPL